MAKINILPSKVYNRIAAGEVVERPCSVVKELIENSIDAGATELEIHIERGGKQLIRVVDNGCGIERDDLPSAFLPHATSKIAVAEDLENILTLGFRGEAIASIASVSQMSITSKTKDGKCYRLCSNGGELGQITEAAGENGTDVSVEMLFFNAPVRLNFLKTDKGEEAEITACISRFILNRSDISFTYYADGKKVLQSFGGSDEEALISVYGATVLRECIQIDAEKHGVRVRGYIGNQNFYKANKSYQSVFLNGRYVVNATIASAVSNAYSSYLMKRQYPFYVLHIDLPPEIVDVNVHPNKADVRFSDNKVVYGCIYSVISAVLDGSSKALEYVVSDGLSAQTADENEAKTEVSSTIKSNVVQAKAENAEQKLIGADKPFGFSTLTYEQAKKEIEQCKPSFSMRTPDLDLPFEEDMPVKGVFPASQTGPGYVSESGVTFTPLPHPEPNPEKLLKTFPGLHFERSVIHFEDSDGEQTATADGNTANEDILGSVPVGGGRAIETSTEQATENATQKEVLPGRPLRPYGYYATEQKEDYPREIDIFAENKRLLAERDARAKQEKMEVSSFTYAGKLFNTYLMYERGDEIYIIDQHAAHERLIFNRLREKMRKREVVLQPLLMPYEIQVNDFESEFLHEQEKNLAEMGITIVEHAKNIFRVTSIPADAWRMDVNAFVHEILSEINGYRAIRLEELIKDKLATSACKAAIKGGMNISQKEIDELFRMMDGDMGLKCPHGRPVVVKMTRKSIEKMFKRIV